MTMKQQTVRGMPQWGKFKDAVSALRSQVNWLLAANNEESAFFAGMIAEGIEKSPKFFVPNVSGVFRRGDLIPTYDGEKYIPYKLPYPKMALLQTTMITDTRPESPNSNVPIESCKVSFLMQDQERKDSSTDILCTTVVCDPTSKQWISVPLFARFCFESNISAIPQDEVSYCYTLELNADKFTSRVVEVLLEDKDFKGDRFALEKSLVADFRPDFFSTATFCKLLEITDCKQVPINVPAKLAKKHARNNTGANYDYKVLSIGGEIWDSSYAHGISGGGSGKRSHMRRGHIRTYQSGKKVWVNSTFVNGSKEGFVEKDYNVKA
jgi:hypothetical protein